MPEFDLEKLRQLSIRKIIGHETGREFVQRGTKEVTNCPMHKDPGPSLAIDEDQNLWYCHGACGIGGDAIRFIELSKGLDFQGACKYLAETFDSSAISEGDGPKGKAKSSTGKGRKPMPMMPIPEGALKEALDNTLKGEWWIKNYGKAVAAWRYHDSKGGVTYIDIRFEKEVKGQKKKQVIPLYFGKTGRWKMGIPFEIVSKERILYNLHLLAARPDHPALVVEGCKCASVDAPGLRDRFIMTTWPGGTNGISKVDIRPLYGRKVYIWPDNDAVNDHFERGGYKAAYCLAEMLGSKSEVTILRGAEHPQGKETKHGYDIADYVDDGGNPLEYIEDIQNIITLEDTRGLAGLKMPEADDMPDFRDVRKFSVINEPAPEVFMKVKDNLARNDKGNITKSDGNFLYIVENDPVFRYLVAYDTATSQLQHSADYTELDELDNSLWQYCQRFYDIAPTKTQRTDMVKSIAYRNSYNSLEVFFDELKVNLFGEAEPTFEQNPLLDILGYMRFAVEDEFTDALQIREYYTELFHKYFLRMFIKLEYIIRGEMDMIPPGDIVPILEGDQGIGKTRFCLFLSIEPQKYYVDMAELQLTTSRDTIAKIRGKLIGELGELAGLKRTELEAIKAFISATFDEMRRLYSESTVRSPRTISFIGTTNEREYLRDTTGNRRFWPVRIEYMDHSLYSEKQLVKQLYVYYRMLAKKCITGDRVQESLAISDGLQDFMLYLREEKRVQASFIDDLYNYIINLENNTPSKEPVKANVNFAASTIYHGSANIPPTLPPRFLAEFNRLLAMRGYKRTRGNLEGKACRYWQLDGRYCVGCKSVVQNMIGVTIGGDILKLCEDCHGKKETFKNAEEPF